MGRKKGDDIDSANMTTTEHNISLLEEQVAIAIEAKALAYRQAVSITTRWKPRFLERHEDMLDERRERNRLMLGGLKWDAHSEDIHYSLIT